RALALAFQTEAAVREFESAYSVLNDCGAVRLADQAAKELRGLGQYVARKRKPRGETGEDPGALSSGEREIAELVAPRYNNTQIAEKPNFSRRTIETRLTHIFAKLGVSNRAGLAAAMQRTHGDDR